MNPYISYKILVEPERKEELDLKNVRIKIGKYFKSKTVKNDRYF